MWKSRKQWNVVAEHENYKVWSEEKKTTKPSNNQKMLLWEKEYIWVGTSIQEVLNGETNISEKKNK